MRVLSLILIVLGVLTIVIGLVASLMTVVIIGAVGMALGALAEHRRSVPSIMLVAVSGAASAADTGNPLAAEQSAALADARRLGAAAVGVKYFTVWGLSQQAKAEHRQAGDYWDNSTSVEAELAHLRPVTATLFAIQRDDLGWPEAVFDAAALEDPVFHVRLKQVAGSLGRAYFPATKDTKAGWYEATFPVAKEVSAIAPWMPAADAAELVALTQTASPLLRLDWFLSRIATQPGRKGTGYYDVLRLKKRDDFEKLVGLNRKESQRVKREVDSIVKRSGVSNFPRQIERLQGVTGGYWKTKDVLDDNKDERNALRQLDEDYKHQAEEHYGFLPNGLFAFYLSDAAGVQQDSAPDRIGSDKTAPGNDGRILVGISCSRCHSAGLKEITDWGRQVFSGPLKLSSPDPEKARRLKQLYLGELYEKFADDNAAYAKVLKRCNGLTPEANAKVVAKVWEQWVERDWMPADVAALLGVETDEYLAKLRENFRVNPLADPVLASHIARPPVAIRADDLEQLLPLVLPTILGTPGKGKP